MIIYQLIEERVKEVPDAIAVEYENKHLTYSELNARANQLARYLRRRGVKANSLVAICVERSFEMIIGILGVLKAGGAYVPLDPNYPDERLKYMLSDTKADLLLTQKHLETRLLTLFDNEEGIVSLDSDWDKIESESRDNLSSINTSSDLAYVIYTSGSTGKPKGVMISHAGLFNRLAWMQDEYKLVPTDKILQKTSFCFDVSVWELLWGIAYGGSFVFLLPGEHKNPDKICEAITRHNISIIHFVPSMLDLFSEVNRGLTNLRLLVTSGEALQIHHVEKAGRPVINLYGPTEASIDVTHYEIYDWSNLKSIPIGKPISNTQMYILDNDLNLQPIGAIGEICIGGVGLARGYLNKPTLTAEKFIANPFGNGDRLYRTGDLGRYLPDGNIEYLGRIDKQVKIRGFRIELGEIENTINTNEMVASSAVLAKEDESGSKYLVAYVVPKTTDGFDKAYDVNSQIQKDITVFEGISVAKFIEKIRLEISSVLPDYMIPSFFIVLDGLPLTTNGKRDDKLLLSLDTRKRSSVDDYVAPRNDTEKTLCKIWQDVLQLDRVGINDNFFKIGGHSVKALAVVLKVNSHFNVSIKLSEFIKNATISYLSNAIEFSETLNVLVDLNESGKYPPLFMVHPSGIGCEVYEHLAKQLVNDWHCIGVDSYNIVNKNKIANLKDLASYYLSQIDKDSRFNRLEHFFLMGWSLGGQIALEMAAILEQRGHKQITVFLLDTVIPNSNLRKLDKIIDGKSDVHQHDEQIRLLDSIERCLVYQDISNKLAVTHVVLLKATKMPPSLSFDEERRVKYILGLHENNVGKYLETKSNLRVVKLNAHHYNMLDFVADSRNLGVNLLREYF